MAANHSKAPITDAQLCLDQRGSPAVVTSVCLPANLPGVTAQAPEEEGNGGLAVYCSKDKSP